MLTLIAGDQRSLQWLQWARGDGGSPAVELPGAQGRAGEGKGTFFLGMVALWGSRPPQSSFRSLRISAPLVEDRTKECVPASCAFRVPAQCES